MELTKLVLKAFFTVYKELGFGFLESVYANALSVELGRLRLTVLREAPIEIIYRGVPVGHYRADIIVDEVVLIEVKSSKATTEADERQLLNYLKASKQEIGFLLHFGPTPKHRRLIYTNDRK